MKKVLLMAVLVGGTVSAQAERVNYRQRRQQLERQAKSPDRKKAGEAEFQIAYMDMQAAQRKKAIKEFEEVLRNNSAYPYHAQAAYNIAYMNLYDEHGKPLKNPNYKKAKYYIDLAQGADSDARNPDPEFTDRIHTLKKYIHQRT